LARRQQQVVRRWLRHAENLSDTKERVVYICEPEVGESSVMRRGDQAKIS
jgi:hypothetical protein